MMNRGSRGHLTVRGERIGFERRTTAKTFAKDAFERITVVTALHQTQRDAFIVIVTVTYMVVLLL